VSKRSPTATMIKKTKKAIIEDKKIRRRRRVFLHYWDFIYVENPLIIWIL